MDRGLEVRIGGPEQGVHAAAQRLGDAAVEMCIVIFIFNLKCMRFRVARPRKECN